MSWIKNDPGRLSFSDVYEYVCVYALPGIREPTCRHNPGYAVTLSKRQRKMPEQHCEVGLKMGLCPICIVTKGVGYYYRWVDRADGYRRYLTKQEE